MKTLKWFGQNLCLTNEEWDNSNLEKVVSGSELCKYLSKLNNYTWYKNRTEKKWKYVVGCGRIYYMDDAEFWRNIHSQTGIFNVDDDFYKVRIKKTKDGREWSIEEDGVNALYWNHVPHGYLGKPKKNRSSYYNMKYRSTKNTDIIYKILLKHSFNQNELCQLIKEINQYNSKNCWYTMDFIQWSIPGKFFIGGKEYNEIKLNFSWDLFTRRDKYNFIAQTKNNSNEFSIGNSKWCAKHAQFEMVKGGWYYLA